MKVIYRVKDNRCNYGCRFKEIEYSDDENPINIAYNALHDEKRLGVTISVAIKERCFRWNLNRPQSWCKTKFEYDEYINYLNMEDY